MGARSYSNNAQGTKRVGGMTYKPRIFVASLGQIADPTIPPSGAELLNPKKLWARLLSVVRNYASLFQVRKLLKKEKYPTSAWLIVGRWTAEAADHYRAFCEARANGNTQALRKLATDEFYDVLKGSVIEPSNKLKREWESKDLRVKVLALRMVMLQEPDVKFAQILFRFTSQQKFKITDSKGALVAGSDTAVPVTEYYVLERPLQDIHLFEWRFMGKLDPNHKEALAKPLLEQ
jgi:hypothetical protein